MVMRISRKFEASEGMYYNEYYPGHQIAMPSILMDDIVEYSDGTEATQSQIAKDVTSFLPGQLNLSLKKGRA